MALSALAVCLGLLAFVGAHLLHFGLTRSLTAAVPLAGSARGSGDPPALPTLVAVSLGVDAGRTIKVMSYNLNHVVRGNDNAPENVPHFRRGMGEGRKILMTLAAVAQDPGRLDDNLDRMVAVIRAEDPDILFLQEVDRDVVESQQVDLATRLAARIGLPYAIWGPKWSMDFGVARHVTGNAILSRFPLTDATNIPLNEVTFLRRCLGLHMVLSATARIDGAPVRLLNTHLYSKKTGYEKKAVQVHRLLQLVADSAAPVIWGGDLNSSVKRLRSRRPSSKDPTLPLVWGSGLADSGGFFAPDVLDYILLRPGDGTWYRHEQALPPVASDHHILVAEIGLAQRPGLAASLDSQAPLASLGR